MHTSKKSVISVTVFIQRSCNEVFCTQAGLRLRYCYEYEAVSKSLTQMTDLCWQLSVVRASSQMVVQQCCNLQCCGLWREECMQCVS